MKVFSGVQPDRRHVIRAIACGTCSTISTCATGHLSAADLHEEDYDCGICGALLDDFDCFAQPVQTFHPWASFV